MPFIFARGARLLPGKRCAFVSSIGVHRDLSSELCPPQLDPVWHVVVRVEHMDQVSGWCTVVPLEMDNESRDRMLSLDWDVAESKITDAMHTAGHREGAGGLPLRVKFHRDARRKMIYTGEWRLGPFRHPQTIPAVTAIEAAFVRAVSAELLRVWKEVRGGDYYAIVDEPEYPISVTIRTLEEDEVTRRVVHRSFTGQRAPPRERPPAPPETPKKTRNRGKGRQ